MSVSVDLFNTVFGPWLVPNKCFFVWIKKKKKGTTRKVLRLHENREMLRQVPTPLSLPALPVLTII